MHRFAKYFDDLGLFLREIAASSSGVDLGLSVGFIFRQFGNHRGGRWGGDHDVKLQIQPGKFSDPV